MGLPPIISLLTETLPILRKGRFPADDFPDAGMALAVAAAIDAATDLFNNCRRVSLFDILVFLAITFYKPKHPIRLICRVAYRLGEKYTLLGPELEFFGRVPLVAIMEMSGKSL